MSTRSYFRFRSFTSPSSVPMTELQDIFSPLNQSVMPVADNVEIYVVVFLVKQCSPSVNLKKMSFRYLLFLKKPVFNFSLCIKQGNLINFFFFSKNLN